MKTVEIFTNQNDGVVTEYHTDSEQPTLRDRFAMAAMASLNIADIERAAKYAYQMADAMMSAREEKS